MALSEAIIAHTVADVIGGTSWRIARRVAVGATKVKGKHHDIYLHVRRGRPRLRDREQNYMREFLYAGGFVFDLWMKSVGTWHKRISDRGFILSVELWIVGPLCKNCHYHLFDTEEKGLLFKKRVLACRNCGERHKEIKDASKPANQLGRKVRKLLVHSLEA